MDSLASYASDLIEEGIIDEAKLSELQDEVTGLIKKALDLSIDDNVSPRMDIDRRSRDYRPDDVLQRFGDRMGIVSRKS